MHNQSGWGGNTDGYRCLTGVLDDVRIYDRKLTTNEISALYNNGTGTETNLVSSTTITNVTAMSISSNGINQANSSGANVFMSNVGIGTDNPSEKLHVVGNVRVDGSLTLGGETHTNWPEGGINSSNLLSVVATNSESIRDALGLGSAATYDAGIFITTNGDGSCLTNITAAQVGALSTNAGALIAANNLSDVDNAGIARANIGAVATNGDGSQLSGITAAQVGALSTNGGTMNGELTILNPGGDIPMGIYTNQ